MTFGFQLIQEAGSDHYIHTCCPYVRPHYSKSTKTKQIFTAGRDLGWPSGSLVSPVLFTDSFLHSYNK